MPHFTSKKSIHYTSWRNLWNMHQYDNQFLFENPREAFSMKRFFKVFLGEYKKPYLEVLPENDIGRSLYSKEKSHCIIRFPAEAVRRLETTASVGVNSSKILGLYFLLPISLTEALRFETHTGRWLLLYENLPGENVDITPQIVHEKSTPKVLSEFFPPARW